MLAWAVPPGLTFVYRTHYEGPLSKRVVHLPHASLLEWFREGWAAEDPRAFVSESLRGSVYGLGSAFEKARELGVPAPQTHAALAAHLEEHLYLEGELRLDEHTLRAETDDDEVGLAYFFFDAHAVAEHADALAYLLHEEWPLPGEAGDAGGRAFDPGLSLPALLPVGPASNGEGATYVVLGTFYDSDSLPGGSFVLPGVRLPGLCEHLRRIVPKPMPPTSWGYVAPWPLELRLLRGLVHEGEATLEPALARLREYPVEALGQRGGRELGTGSHAEVVVELADVAGTLPRNSGDASLTRIELGEHIAQVAQHVSKSFGYQQWFLFDDCWAAAHPGLARSLLRYGVSWDPLGGIEEDEEEG